MSAFCQDPTLFCRIPFKGSSRARGRKTSSMRLPAAIAAARALSRVFGAGRGSAKVLVALSDSLEDPGSSLCGETRRLTLRLPSSPPPPPSPPAAAAPGAAAQRRGALGAGAGQRRAGARHVRRGRRAVRRALHAARGGRERLLGAAGRRALPAGGRLARHARQLRHLQGQLPHRGARSSLARPGPCSANGGAGSRTSSASTWGTTATCSRPCWTATVRAFCPP